LHILNLKNLLRLCQLRRFGYLIASLSQSQCSDGGYGFFEYDLNKSAFRAITLTDTKKHSLTAESSAKHTSETDTLKQPSSSARDTQKFQLMKNMAQLRLEAEISQLESSYRSEDLNWSPYLIADTTALCESLKLVQELARSSKFIIIVPLVVIDTLDSIKKESKLAREAIRWLENQFKMGNRFLRAQTHNEKLSLKSEYEPSLKKKNLEGWRFCQLVECCRYFEEESNSRVDSEASRSNMVTVLTSSDMGEQKNKSMVCIAEENGRFLLKFFIKFGFFNSVKLCCFRNKIR
jgi:protein SMG5